MYHVCVAKRKLFQWFHYKKISHVPCCAASVHKFFGVGADANQFSNHKTSLKKLRDSQHVWHTHIWNRVLFNWLTVWDNSKLYFTITKTFSQPQYLGHIFSVICVKRTIDTHASWVNVTQTKKIAWRILRQDTPSFLHNLAPSECFCYLFSPH